MTGVSRVWGENCLKNSFISCGFMYSFFLNSIKIKRPLFLDTLRTNNNKKLLQPSKFLYHSLSSRNNTGLIIKYGVNGKKNLYRCLMSLTVSFVFAAIVSTKCLQCLIGVQWSTHSWNSKIKYQNLCCIYISNMLCTCVLVLSSYFFVTVFLYVLTL